MSIYHAPCTQDVLCPNMACNGQIDASWHSNQRCKLKRKKDSTIDY